MTPKAKAEELVNKYFSLRAISSKCFSPELSIFHGRSEPYGEWISH